MTQFDLSALNGPELRQLLDSARARGLASQSYQILQEMAARREHAQKSLRPRRKSADVHRIVDLDLGDPMEKKDEPLVADGAFDLADRLPPLEPEAPAAQAAPEPEPEPMAKAHSPLHLYSDPAPQVKAASLPPPVMMARHTPRRAPWLAGGLAAGLAAGAGLGWFFGEVSRPAAASAQLVVAAAPKAPPKAKPVLDVVLNTDSVAGVLAPPLATAEPEPEPPAPVELAAAPTAPPAPAVVQPAAAPEPAPEPEPVLVAKVEPAKPPAPPAKAEPAKPTVQLAKAEAAKPQAQLVKAETVKPACAGLPTPADRTICADPELQRLQRELRQAYAEALQAHQDRTLLRQRQLAWRDARSDVSDPARLARLYEQRIRKLTAAAADARRNS